MSDDVSKVCVDHKEMSVGNVGNYYGGLWIKRDGGVDYWSIEDWDGHRWEEIPTSLADELRALGSAK